MVILIHQFFHFGDKWLNCCEIKSSVSPDCGMSCMFVVFSGPKNMFYFGLNFFVGFLVFENLNINECSVIRGRFGDSIHFGQKC